MSATGHVQDTPSPQRTGKIDRDTTPELASKSASAAVASPTASRHSTSRSHRDEHEHRSSSRRHGRSDELDEEEEEEARRRRRRRERERQAEDDEDDPETRRKMRADRKDRERQEEEAREARRRDRERSSRHRDDRDDRKRDRSRDSHRSGGSRGTSARDSRDVRERERAERDREMRREREKEEHYARMDRDRRRGGRDERDYDRSPPPRRRRRGSPSYNEGPSGGADALLDEIDSEARSVFVSQIAGKLTSRDLGAFFEDKLGEGTVRDARIVTDRVSRRSKGIGYVELSEISLVEEALKLSGTIVMGIPILVDLTEAERNKLAAGTTPALLMAGGPASGPGSLPPLAGMRGPTPMVNRDRNADAEIPYHRLYVGSLNFELTADQIREVFMPFGELEFVDLHRDSMTGKSKGFAFVQFKDLESAKTALQTMNGFELAGRQLRVSTVNEKATAPTNRPNEPHLPFVQAGPGVINPNDGNRPESLDDNHGQRMDAAARQALMFKLAGRDLPDATPQPPVHPSRLPMVPVSRPYIPVQPSIYVLVNNMFNPEEETERDWDTDLAEDIKAECEAKYGPVVAIKVEKESQGEVYIQFATLEVAGKAVAGLNGRFFGGRSLVANFLPEVLFKAHVSV